MTRKSLGCVLFANGIAADTLDLRNFSDKLKEANELEGIAKGSPEASMLYHYHGLPIGLIQHKKDLTT